ncbi:putative regulator PrlF [compost metagenome]
MYIRKFVNNRNQVVLPAPVRKELGITKKDQVVFTKNHNGQIVIQKAAENFLMVDTPASYHVNPTDRKK